MTAPTVRHVPVHDSTSDDYGEDPFLEDAFDTTFPPPRYCAMDIVKPQAKTRRESSRERERLYRELVGHAPYRINRQNSAGLIQGDMFFVTLDVKHYRPEEITLKVEGQSLIVSGKHYNETSAGFESSEFQRKYDVPESIDTHTLTSNITTDGLLCIKATKSLAQSANPVDKDHKENFQLSLDVTGYRPDEITIRVNQRSLTIHGETKDEKSEHHGSSVHHQQFTRHFTLPNDVDVDALSSRYTKDSMLTIEAPRGHASAQGRTLEIKEEKE